LSLTFFIYKVRITTALITEGDDNDKMTDIYKYPLIMLFVILYITYWLDFTFSPEQFLI
jgi:hypothetical protein